MTNHTDLQDPPLDPIDTFISGLDEVSDSSSYCTNEFSLKGMSELRLGIRWMHSKYIDYEARNYRCRYAQLIFEDPIELAAKLKKSAILRYKENYYNKILEQIKIFIERSKYCNENPSEDDFDDTESFNFPFACQLILLIALANKDQDISRAFENQIRHCYKRGYEGIHIELTWNEHIDPHQIEIRLLNSWENEPRYIHPHGETGPTIVPRVLISFMIDLPIC